MNCEIHEYRNHELGGLPVLRQMKRRHNSDKFKCVRKAIIMIFIKNCKPIYNFFSQID